MNKKLSILNAIDEVGVFSTTSEIAEHMLGTEEFKDLTDFQKKKERIRISAHLNSLIKKDDRIIIKIIIPTVAVYFGLKVWIEDDDKIKVDRLPDVAKKFINLFKIEELTSN